MVHSIFRCTWIGYLWRMRRPLFQFAVTVSIFTLTRRTPLYFRVKTCLCEIFSKSFRVMYPLFAVFKQYFSAEEEEEDLDEKSQLSDAVAMTDVKPEVSVTIKVIHVD